MNLQQLADDFDGGLGERSWGEFNRADIRHPLSPSLGFLARWLDMPREPLDGDSNVPRVVRSDFGASERFGVSPGNEQNGYLHMPAGQSGHPFRTFTGPGTTTGCRVAQLRSCQAKMRTPLYWRHQAPDRPSLSPRNTAGILSVAARIAPELRMTSKKFDGTNTYIATDDLKMAVNAAVTLQRPILVKGEPGTGKTQLALEIANSLGYPLFEWHIKSTTKAQQGLYDYDAVARLRDSQLGDERVHDIANYIVRGKVWEAFESAEQPVLLIDEIDKADIEFPNDLLQELDRMEFFVYETRQLVSARHRPIIIITSNNEKELPDAFLRRCFFHYIRFPDKETMARIIDVHFPKLKKDLLREALEAFYRIRDVPGLKKKPSTSELLDWIKLLLAEDIPPEALRSDDSRKAIPPLYGALLKNEQDVHLFEQLLFLDRRSRTQ
jgi:MoxR-like ATPase